ncbi:NAD-dependent protein deacylase [Cereibacter sphaeroides]|uniref:SIR2 family NAD-dependent protein deacylase n=1 Tax=Cereibacter sphaeroides TaxID=1063 RepID=UPI001F225C93|nr:Sir2 family NAD-dependent protein deacetylase [Cereibacter sphaeroides]MCE6959600.1 NAD-dependent protein deacylase [Cereibacter sphaeroides]MCE6974540.1 NAD-dependent protein deacylase [Cereibacter sphaeroides]
MMHDRHLVCFSGAGLSADSGLSTFRGGDGLWENHRIEDVCDITTWKQNRETVHRFYNDRRAALASVQPNPMHRLLVDWQSRYRTTLVTQNVDNLLEQAGARDVLHVHGRLTEMECLACGHVWEIGTAAWNAASDRCPDCGSLKGVKPNVVFFHEQAPLYQPMWKLFNGLKADDVLVVIGTDGAVVPIGAVAAAVRCRKALNNLEPVPLEDWVPGMVAPAFFHHALFKPAAEAVDELDAIVRGWMEG